MDTRNLSLAFARTRMAIGIGMLVAPGLVARVWGGPGANTAAARLFARTTGVREIALGLGTEIATKSGTRPADWLSMSACCDAADAVIAFAGPNRSVVSVGVGLSAVAAGISQFTLAQRFAKELGDDPRA